MNIENLTRFIPAVNLTEPPRPVMMQTLEEDSYVRFLDVKELLKQADNKQSTPCEGMHVHRVLLLAGVERCPVCRKVLG